MSRALVLFTLLLVVCSSVDAQRGGRGGGRGGGGRGGGGRRQNSPSPSPVESAPAPAPDSVPSEPPVSEPAPSAPAPAPTDGPASLPASTTGDIIGELLTTVDVEADSSVPPAPSSEDPVLTTASVPSPSEQAPPVMPPEPPVMSPEPSAMSTEPIEPPHHEPVEGAEGGDTNEDVDDDMEASGSGEAVGHDDLEEPDEVGTSPEIETDGASNAKVLTVLGSFIAGWVCLALF